MNMNIELEEEEKYCCECKTKYIIKKEVFDQQLLNKYREQARSMYLQFYTKDEIEKIKIRLIEVYCPTCDKITVKILASIEASIEE